MLEPFIKIFSIRESYASIRLMQQKRLGSPQRLLVAGLVFAAVVLLYLSHFGLPADYPCSPPLRRSLSISIILLPSLLLFISGAYVSGRQGEKKFLVLNIVGITLWVLFIGAIVSIAFSINFCLDWSGYQF